MDWREAEVSRNGGMETQLLELIEFTRAEDYRRKAEHLRPGEPRLPWPGRGA